MAASTSSLFFVINTSVFQLPSLPPCQLTLLSCLKLDIVLLWTNVKKHTTVCFCFYFQVLQDWITVLVNRLNIFNSVSCRFASTNRVLPPQPHWPETLLISNAVSRAAPYFSLVLLPYAVSNFWINALLFSHHWNKTKLCYLSCIQVKISYRLKLLKTQD